MNLITTTQLRSKTSSLIKSLLEGNVVTLIHRSAIVGEIRPKETQTKVLTKTDIQELKKLANKLNFPKTSYNEREKIYRKHLMDKYGQGLS